MIERQRKNELIIYRLYNAMRNKLIESSSVAKRFLGSQKYTAPKYENPSYQIEPKEYKEFVIQTHKEYINFFVGIIQNIMKDGGEEQKTELKNIIRETNRNPKVKLKFLDGTNFDGFLEDGSGKLISDNNSKINETNFRVLSYIVNNYYIKYNGNDIYSLIEKFFEDIIQTVYYQSMYQKRQTGVRMYKGSVTKPSLKILEKIFDKFFKLIKLQGNEEEYRFDYDRDFLLTNIFNDRIKNRVYKVLGCFMNENEKCIMSYQRKFTITNNQNRRRAEAEAEAKIQAEARRQAEAKAASEEA